jgi:hypothetical protein
LTVLGGAKSNLNSLRGQHKEFHCEAEKLRGHQPVLVSKMGITALLDVEGDAQGTQRERSELGCQNDSMTFYEDYRKPGDRRNTKILSCA